QSIIGATENCILLNFRYFSSIINGVGHTHFVPRRSREVPRFFGCFRACCAEFVPGSREANRPQAESGAMATVQKRLNKWRSQIRRQGHALSKTLSSEGGRRRMGA